MAGRLRDLEKESLWRRMVSNQAESGLSVGAWCRRHRLQEANFYRWRRELGRRDAERPAFVPVHVTEDPALQGTATIEIVLAGGHRIRLSGQVDRQALGNVLAVLEGRAC